MTSRFIAGVRSVALSVPDLDATGRFYVDTWHLDRVATSADAVYLRGTGGAHHILSLHRGPRTAIRNVTLEARSAAALQSIAEAAAPAGGALLRPPAPLDEPGGGVATTIADGDGRILRIVHGDTRHPEQTETADKPVRLAHVVLNSHDVAASQRFFERVLDFTLSDRTRIMAFLRCNSDHHSIALADADEDSLNHIAFLMPDIESVMRGGGRMKDAGHPIEWGPGRHGPGNNAFNYFIDPNGVAIEYTAEVLQIDDSYEARGPDEWKWPAGRVDHWGISAPPSARLKEVQKQIRFVDR